MAGGRLGPHPRTSLTRSISDFQRDRDRTDMTTVAREKAQAALPEPPIPGLVAEAKKRAT